MVGTKLVDEIKLKIEAGAEAADPDDILQLFELMKQITEEVDYLKKDTIEEKMIGQVNLSDVDKSYWFKASEGLIEYGEGKIDDPLFLITTTKDIGLGLFLGEVDANIVSPLGKLKIGGNYKTLRAFQEFYEDSIEEFKKRY